MKRVLYALMILWSGMAAAGVVYKWVDAQGKVEYGDRPPDGVRAEVVEVLGGHAGHPGRTADSPPATKPAPGEPTAKDAKKAVDSDVSQARDKQCAEAQERYRKLIEGRRLYKTGADGEREYLTSEEIDSERVNAKRDIDSICNSPT